MDVPSSPANQKPHSHCCSDSGCESDNMNREKGERVNIKNTSKMIQEKRGGKAWK